MFNTATFIQNCVYMNFRINLTQFDINFLRQEHQIEVLNVSIQRLRFSGSSGISSFQIGSVFF